MRCWIKKPEAVWLGSREADSAGGIVIDDGIVTEHLSLDEKPLTEVDEVFDARSMVLLPGLINCHHHFYQTLTRALPQALNKELFNWLVSLYPVWANLDEERVRVSTKLALSELLLSGCTTASDHHYLFNANLDRAVDIQVEVAEELGVRVALTRGSMSLGVSDGGLPPDLVVQDEMHILRESERLIQAYHQKEVGAMVTIALAPCSPFSVSELLMSESAALARKHGVLLHTHLAETLDENQFCIDRFGLRPVDYLEKVGWLESDVWLAHGIHFNDEEVQRLGAAGVGVSHCPSSNMMLASGKARVLELEAAGCSVGLGVDGSASNDGSNMLDEVRQAFLLQRLHYGSGRVSHEDALRWATSGGAGLLARPEIGSLEVGAQADLALIDLNALRFSGNHHPLAAIPLCGANRAHSVMVAGKWQVKNNELLHVDHEKLMHEHRQAAKELVALSV